jgi:endonuclease/exonuclease/phosphatase family metal-dependent hydrolase
MFMNALNIMSYNLRYHRAFHEVADLVKKHRPDVLCLQECFADELTTKIGRLRLVATTTIGRLGMAIYAPAEFLVDETHEIALPLSLFERSLRKERTRLLVAELTRKKTGHKLIIGSFHATELVAPNALRHRQIHMALDHIRGLGENSAAVLIGDYNYPFPKNGLKQLIEDVGFELAVSHLSTYKRRLFQGVFDFASVRNLDYKPLTVLPFSLSDHAPVFLSCTERPNDLL